MQTNSVLSPNSFHYTQQREQSSIQLENREGLQETGETGTQRPFTNSELESKQAEEKNKEKNITEIKDSVEHLNELMKTHYTSLKFNMHEELDRMYVQVVDQHSDKVIREIPEKEFLDMISKMVDFVGVMIDKKA